MKNNTSQFTIDGANKQVQYSLVNAYNDLTKILKEIQFHPNDKLNFNDESIVSLLKLVNANLKDVNELVKPHEFTQSDYWHFQHSGANEDEENKPKYDASVTLAEYESFRKLNG